MISSYSVMLCLCQPCVSIKISSFEHFPNKQSLAILKLQRNVYTTLYQNKENFYLIIKKKYSSEMN